MQLPSRLSIAIGTMVAGLIAVSGEVSLSHPLHQTIILVGAFLLFILHPSEGGIVRSREPHQEAAPPYAIGAPTPVPAPPAPAPPAPQAQSLP